MHKILERILVKAAALSWLSLLGAITVICIKHGNVSAGICVTMFALLMIVCLSILEERESGKT